VNIGCGKDVSIRELAELVAQGVDFRGALVFDSSKPDGTPRKPLDISRLLELGWKPSIALREGLVKAYRDFLQRQTLTTGVESATGGN
jgi:GDP-L-fucose synthase